MIVLPAKILEERGRGTEIHSVTDQAKLPQYWAWSQLPIEVGVLVPETNHPIEYWMFLTLQPLPDDEEVTTYPLAPGATGPEFRSGLNGAITLSDSVPALARKPISSAAVTFLADIPVTQNRSDALSANVPASPTQCDILSASGPIPNQE
jgi:hypothetical protein